MEPAAAAPPAIVVSGLTMAYGSFVLQRNLTFEVRRGSVFIIMCGSGCGKSTLLRHLIGHNRPAAGEISYDDASRWAATPEPREALLRRVGVLYPTRGLWDEGKGDGCGIRGCRS